MSVTGRANAVSLLDSECHTALQVTLRLRVDEMLAWPQIRQRPVVQRAVFHQAENTFAEQTFVFRFNRSSLTPTERTHKFNKG